ncbi:MAG: lytic murein transglycosylase [Rhizobiaceae bacterium]
MRAWMTALLAALVLATPAAGADRKAVERQFRAFLDNEIRGEAARSGVSREIFDAALGAVTLDWSLPDLVPPGIRVEQKAQHQAEFRSPEKYFADKQIAAVVRGGRARADKERANLRRAEKLSGVPSSIILAIWGRESGFGAAKIPHDAYRVLATKAFMSTRRDMFRAELVAALKIVADGYAEPAMMRSSWAGALGQPQFMPTKYLAHAVDADGDGRRDIWRSSADTVGSIANYLKDFGWDAGRGWGYEIVAPAGLSCAMEGPDRGRPLAAWEKDGVRRANGQPFPASERGRELFLMMPAGRSGPAFLVTANFYVLKAYNESDLYALFIGHSADRISGNEQKIAGKWTPVDSMLRSDVARIQLALETQGHDVGGADGLPGFKTRRSIGAWQQSRGETPTCYPSKTVAKALR